MQAARPGVLSSDDAALITEWIEAHTPPHIGLAPWQRQFLAQVIRLMDQVPPATGRAMSTSRRTPSYVQLMDVATAFDVPPELLTYAHVCTHDTHT